jgi:3-oxoacyl-[acyl-carrier-protein] synthase-3
MKERRIAKEDEFTSDLGFEAAKKALKSAKIKPEEIDLILVATLTPDYIFPSTACLIQAKLKATKAAAFDLQAACTGYIYALSMAKAFIESGLYRNVLIVASEKLSSVVDYKDRNTCVLFGDGASACVVSDAEKGLWIRNSCLGCDGEQTEILMMPAGGCRMPASQETVAQQLHTIKMDGKETFKHAVRRMESSSKECLDQAGMQEDQISWIVPHQANMRIIEAIAKRFKVPMERVYITIHKYGNTSASSVGIALDELLKEKKISKGENLLLTAFGAGLTWGSTILSNE